MSTMSEKRKRQIQQGIERRRREVERADLRSGKVVAGETLMLCQIAELLEDIAVTLAEHR